MKDMSSQSLGSITCCSHVRLLTHEVTSMIITAANHPIISSHISAHFSAPQLSKKSDVCVWSVVVELIISTSETDVLMGLMMKLNSGDMTRRRRRRWDVRAWLCGVTMMRNISIYTQIICKFTWYTHIMRMQRSALGSRKFYQHTFTIKHMFTL